MINLNKPGGTHKTYNITFKGIDHIRAGGYTKAFEAETAKEAKSKKVDNLRLLLEILAVVAAFSALFYSWYTDNKAEEYRQRTEVLEKQLNQLNNRFSNQQPKQKIISDDSSTIRTSTTQ